jgi:hypothetical protein
LDPPWHAFYEVLTHIQWNPLPLFSHSIPKFMDTFWGVRILLQLDFHIIPEVFNGVQVRRLGWHTKDIDVIELKHV